MNNYILNKHLYLKVPYIFTDNINQLFNNKMVKVYIIKHFQRSQTSTRSLFSKFGSGNKITFYQVIINR